MPTRYLKPGVRDSEAIESLSPNAEILYYRLIVTVDDFGRYDARPSMVKAACFPIRESMTASKVEALLKELSEHGLVVVYQVDGKPYMQLCKWDNVPRAKESKYPALESECMQMYADVCNTNTDAPLTVTVTKTETVTKTGNRKQETAHECAQPEYPAGLDVSAWDRWVDYRKGIGKPLKPVSWPAAMQAMAKHTQNQSAVVDQSIAAGWQGLFALKEGAALGKQQTETAYQRSMRLRVQEVAPSIARQEPYEDAAQFFRTIDITPEVQLIEEKK